MQYSYTVYNTLYSNDLKSYTKARLLGRGVKGQLSFQYYLFLYFTKI